MRIPTQSLGNGGALTTARINAPSGAGVGLRPAARSLGGGFGISQGSCDEGLVVCLAGCAWLPWPLSASCATGCSIGWEICRATGFVGGGGGVFAA